MSVVINYVSNNISIIATDTRVTNIDGGWEDGHKKLINLKSIGLGWTSGTGWGCFLDDFKDKLSKIHIRNQSDIMQLYKKTASEWLSKELEYEHDIYKSAFAISLITENMKKSIIKLISKKHYGQHCEDMGYDEFVIFFPANYESKESVWLKSFHEKFSYDYTFDNNLRNLIIEILDRFYFVKCTSDQLISADCDIGIQMLTSEGLKKYYMKYDNIKRFKRDKRENFDFTKLLIQV